MLTRRTFLVATAATLGAGPALAKPLDLDWDDLVPDGDTGKLLKDLRGVVQHGQLTTGFDQEAARAVTEEFNGQTVRLPGFVVPLDFSATGVTTFILAPFVGACIHVPPPPANQLVMVTSQKPYEVSGLYDPVEVTGTFGTTATSTELAEVGYTLQASRIRPYKD